MLLIRDDEFLDFMHIKLIEKLDEGAATGDLINITGLRQIGKTLALITFASQHNLPIIMFSTRAVKAIKDVYGYKNIYSQSQHLRGRITEAVIDEFVNRQYVEEQGIRVVTGYYTYFS